MITQITLRQFRNYKLAEFNFDKKIVVITGPNASGKTILLEAIYTSSLTKSFRTNDSNLISYGNDFFTISRYHDKENIDFRFVKSDKSRTKQLKINNVKKPLYSLPGTYPVVLFEPNHLDILVGLPAKRREYIDSILSQTDKDYLLNLKKYAQIISQKNSLLRRAKKEMVGNLNDQLFVFNIQLIEPAMYIVKCRKAFIDAIKPNIINNYKTISKQQVDLSLKFLTLVNDKDDFIKELDNSIERDKATGFSTFGPHRDDFSVELKNHSLNEIASRGELRSLTLAFKLTEINYIQNILNKKPTLLLDDVLSELDEDRQRHLLSNIHAEQTFITTTHLPPNTKLDFQHIKLPL